MTRSVALRGSLVLSALATLLAITGLVSGVPIAEALFMIAGSLCAVMLFFAWATPAYAPVPVPVRVRRRH